MGDVVEVGGDGEVSGVARGSRPGRNRTAARSRSKSKSKQNKEEATFILSILFLLLAIDLQQST